MLHFKKILVPYDGSDHAKKALKEAVSIAETCEDAKLFVATVVYPVPSTVVIAEEHAFVFDAERNTESMKIKETTQKEIRKLLPSDIPHEILFNIGNPGSVLLSLAKEHDCDLIVMGSRGRGALKSLLLGSVSAHLVSNAHCPVLVIK